ncbi:hypothetical protein [Alkalibacterium indicireducens]|uniref:hypothetical protein n=1 Tax=Alkalibacterium indicireducens TaxID=398758 RepID=UPI0031F9C8E7
MAILAYEVATVGFDQARENPLWFPMVATGAVYAYLQSSISIDQESKKVNSKTSLMIALSIVGVIALVLGLASAMTDGGTPVTGLILGLVFFVCGLVPSVYIYNLRKEREDDTAD